MKKLLIALTTLVAVTFAQDYGMAGCGLGSVIFGADGIQTSAATTNGSSFNKYSGMSSGTSNCVEDEIAMDQQEQRHFFSANYESLKQEMAVGTGENFEVFVSLVGCQGADVQAAQKIIQDNYSEIFTTGEVKAEQALENTQKVIYSSDIDSCVETI